MAWYEVLILILGIITSIFGILGISAYVSERMKHKANRVNIREDQREAQREQEIAQLEEARHERYKQELREIIREETDGLKKDIAQIKSNLALNTEGTVTILRNDMKKALDYCNQKGYASGT